MINSCIRFIKGVLDRLNINSSSLSTWNAALGGLQRDKKAIRISYSDRNVEDYRELVVFVKSTTKPSAPRECSFDFKAAKVGFDFIGKSTLCKLNTGKDIILFFQYFE